MSLSAAQFPDTIKYDTTVLQKKGEGTFRWTIFRVYDGALYLDKNNMDSPPLSNIAKELVLKYNASIDAEDFVKAGNKILKENLSTEDFNKIQNELITFNKAYLPVEKGDQYSLTYLPEKGTTLAFNKEPLITVEGEEFAVAYFSIWLGGNPIKESFKADLLSE